MPAETSLYQRYRDAIAADRPVALLTVVDGPGLANKLLIEPGQPPVGSLGDPDLDRVAARDAEAELAAARSGVRHYGAHGEARADDVSVYVEVQAPPPQMVIFGAVDFTGALVRVAKVLGYRTTVCDARPVFATTQRFPLADRVVVDWPNRLLAEIGAGLGPRDAVCVLTHDPKFDVPAIVAALETEVGYLGAMGSRRTHERRVERLREEGVTDEQLQRLMAPIGLDIGARTPEEVAVAICGEIISLRAGRPAAHLREGTGPIHA